MCIIFEENSKRKVPKMEVKNNIQTFERRIKNYDPYLSI